MKKIEKISAYEMSQLFNELYKDNKDANKIVREFEQLFYLWTWKCKIWNRIQF